MKTKTTLLLLCLLLFSGTSFSRQVYTLTKQDFSAQFNSDHSLRRVYCLNEKGEKIWLNCNDNTILTISLATGTKEPLLLTTIRFRDQRISSRRYNVWMPSGTVHTFAFDDVTAISIERRFQEYERPYFNYDSSLSVAKRKNDSLKIVYSAGTDYYISVVGSDKSRADSLRIVPEALYTLSFHDGTSVRYGIVRQITRDSIDVIDASGVAGAGMNEVPSRGYRIQDIEAISGLRSGGFSYRSIALDNCIVRVDSQSRNPNARPYWFAVNPSTGAVNFYRSWRTDQGFVGITLQGGKAIWYEGERRE